MNTAGMFPTETTLSPPQISSTMTESTTPLQFTLPDLLAKFPWPRNLSEHFCEAKAESSAWTESFHPFDEDGLKGFNLCDFSKSISPAFQGHISQRSFIFRSPCLLSILPSRERQVARACWVSSSVSDSIFPVLELIRLGCDLMNLFYVFDEYTDIADGEGATKIRDIVMDAFRNPHKSRPEGELLLGEMAREFVTTFATLSLILQLIPSASY